MLNVYESSEIADRIRIIAKAKNISITNILSEIGLGKNTLMNFKTSMPKADNLAKIADYLDCSVDYLLGRKEISNGNTISYNANSGNNIINDNKDSLDGLSREMLIKFDELEFPDKAKVMSLIAELSEKTSK